MTDETNYVTMNQLADELDVSRTRISQYISQLELADELIAHGRQKLITPDTADKIRERANQSKAYFVSTPKVDVEDLQAELSDAEATVADQEATITDLQKQLAKAEKDVQDLKHANKILEENLKGCESVITSKEETIETLNETVNGINKKYDSLDTKLQNQQELSLMQLRALAIEESTASKKPENIRTESDEPAVEAGEEPNKGFLKRMFS